MSPQHHNDHDTKRDPLWTGSKCYKISLNPLEMRVTWEEMNEAELSYKHRDYCAHLFIPLRKCKQQNYYSPWACKAEHHLWELCQYKDSMYRKELYKKRVEEGDPNPRRV